MTASSAAALAAAAAAIGCRRWRQLKSVWRRQRWQWQLLTWQSLYSLQEAYTEQDVMQRHTVLHGTTNNKHGGYGKTSWNVAASAGSVKLRHLSAAHTRGLRRPLVCMLRRAAGIQRRRAPPVLLEGHEPDALGNAFSSPLHDLLHLFLHVRPCAHADDARARASMCQGTPVRCANYSVQRKPSLLGIAADAGIHGAPFRQTEVL